MKRKQATVNMYHNIYYYYLIQRVHVHILEISDVNISILTFFTIIFTLHVYMYSTCITSGFFCIFFISTFLSSMTDSSSVISAIIFFVLLAICVDWVPSLERPWEPAVEEEGSLVSPEVT